ncbi:SDR family NAD(P)-dependent oxidoreductase [Vitreoscilla stercoraria]|uniref:SDR family oxidoreductase n=1 Tax=Vitreoscilla stercoraria TaxID=61 RepID=A0ABY4E7G4_VITST|nr:SDR family oxidoreductase [Vitreoscilla stercoraria]UOO91397.1 SDR family oxidoreductase [Vitreoscilla stercoraria]
MQISLKNKIALVTSATAGIGFAIARGLAQSGANVVITGRHQDKINQAVNQIKADIADAQITGLALNAATAEGCQKIIQSLPQVDILINNLGIYGTCEFAEITDEQWFEFFETNIMSGVRLSRHYMKGMKSQGWGRIQFISSESAFNIPADMVHYGMTKSAMQGVSRGLAKALAGTGVTVNTVLPGPTRTEGAVIMIENIAKQQGITSVEAEKYFIEKHRNSSIIRRFTEPREIANMVVYIASEQASATTGAALRVEGGIIDSIH